MRRVQKSRAGFPGGSRPKSPGSADEFVGLLLQTALYAWAWFSDYYPLVRLKLKFYINGHILILLIYLILLVFFNHTWEGNNVGYNKTFDVVLAQILRCLQRMSFHISRSR